MTTAVEKEENNICLPVLRVKIYNVDEEQSTETYMLLDTASQRTIISMQVAKKLELPLEKISVILRTVDDKRAIEMHKSMVLIGDIMMEVLVSGRMDLQTEEMSTDPATDYQEMSHIKFNEKFPRGRRAIDILLGQDLLGKILTGNIIKHQPSGPIAMETIFGWAVGGKIKGSYRSNSMRSLSTSLISNHELSEMFERFWRMENNDMEDDMDTEQTSLSVEDQYAVDYFNQTVRFKNGRYQVPLIYKENAPELQNNFKQAMRRLIFLEKRLLKDPEAIELYKAAMDEYLKRGDAELVPPSELHKENAFFLPHREVLDRTRSTTKCRI